MLKEWISSKKVELRHSASAHSLSAKAETQNIEQVLGAAVHILNDDIDSAEKGLEGGDSSFHKLGKGMIMFLKATLGFEADVMREASEKLAEAEAVASSDHRQAMRQTDVYQSAIYGPGAEFALCTAESQLMGAVVAVLSESLTESVKGFYKMRKAYMTLESIMAAEKNYTKGIYAKIAHSGTNTPRSMPSSPQTMRPAAESSLKPVSHLDQCITASPTEPSQRFDKDDGSDSDDDVFEDAKETVNQTNETTPSSSIELNGKAPILEKRPTSRPETPEGGSGRLHRLVYRVSSRPTTPPEGLQITKAHSSPQSPSNLPVLGAPTSENITLDPNSEEFKHPVDIFIHTGVNTCLGMLNIIISMIPPVFARLLSIVGFRGDREKGLRMLWQATKFENINGAMAGLVVLGYYNGFVGFCDILPDSVPANAGGEDDIEGYPQERLQRLLNTMNSRYPKSMLWRLEAARMAATQQKLDEGITLLSGNEPSQLKQVQALCVFERSLQCMYAHKYQLCHDSFMECRLLNNWSHALYYFTAASAKIELSRLAKTNENQKEAVGHAEEAQKLLIQAKAACGKKKLIGRQLPFDVFVLRKINKWESFTGKSINDVEPSSLMHVIGPSPFEQLIYFWNGHKKMDAAQIQRSLDSLAYVDPDPADATHRTESVLEASASTTAAPTPSSHPPDPTGAHLAARLDDQAVAAVLRAAILRVQGRGAEAQALLRAKVLAHDRASFRGALRDDWTPPVAHYEMAACAWGARDGAGDPARQRSARNRELVREAAEWLDKVNRWGEGYLLDTRVGLKITTAIDTVKRWRALYDYD